MTNEAKILGGLALVTIVIVIGAAIFFGGSQTNTPSQTLPKEKQQFLMRPESNELKAPQAKVTIVEFGDFQCPACGASYPIVTQILKRYKGKVNFVFRHFPLPMHKNAPAAAEAAEAAGAQEKFFPMYDQLYSHQKEWGESMNPNDYFIKYAKILGLDIDKFTKEVKGNVYAAKIQQDVNDGNALNVSATPTFYINNQIQTGFLGSEVFKTAIDDAIKNSK